MASGPRDGRAAATCLPVLLLLCGAELRPHARGEERLQLEAVKRGILERLGMPGPPAVRRGLDPDGVRRARRRYEEKVAELMSNRSREEESSWESSVHRLAPTWQRLPDAPRDAGDPAGPYRYQLVLSRTEVFQRRLRVLQAQLQLFKQALGTSGAATRLDASGPTRLLVSRLPEPGVAGARRRLLQERELPGVARTLDLTAAVRPWAAGSEAALRLELAFTADVSAFLAAGGAGAGSETLTLEVETRQRRAARVRRAGGLEEECGKSDGKCCLKSLKVSFQDIGWADWVLAPNSYYMRFCQGSCPHNYKPASMHAQIKARMHSLSKATPAPCCVPAAYDPMVLMHYDGQGRLVSTVFEDMLVTKCHCA
ncbi:growth/differentiation factor 15 [Struthio camelus]|uniref:growth/differentiation factor 15 n=1 Tax=Struthio camelus TaxID=8801 RepID=UPI003603F145